MSNIITNKNLSPLLYKVNQLAIILISMWIAIPYVRSIVGIMFLFFCLIVWFITTDLRWLTEKWTMDLLFVIIFFITFIPYLMTGNLKYGEFGADIITISFPLFLIGIFINHYYMYYKKDYKTLGRIALFTIIFFMIGSIQTYFGLLDHPMASRELASGRADYIEQYTKLGIGGFGHIYSVVFLLIASLYPLMRKVPSFKVRHKILIVVFIISIFQMLLQASYATSLILVFLGFLLISISRNKWLLATLMAISFIILLILDQRILSDFFLTIADLLSWNNVLNEKFVDLSRSLSSGFGGSQVEYRMALYSSSFATFLANPLFGINGPFSVANSGTIEGHSGWFDLLGYYGLFTALPLFIAFYFNFKKHIKTYKNTYYASILLIIYFLFIIFGAINPILYVIEIGFVIFCVIPAVPYIPYAFKKKKETDL